MIEEYGPYRMTPEQIAFILKQEDKAVQIEKHMAQCPAFCLMEIRRLKYTGRAFRRVPPTFWENYALCLEAVRADGAALEWVSATVMCEELCIEAVKADGFNLGSVPDAYKSEEVCLAAVKQNGLAIKYAPPLRLTKKIVREAIQQNLAAFGLIAEGWRDEGSNGKTNA
jgi:hypothetical protein